MDDKSLPPLPVRWAKAWTEKDSATWLALYSPTAEYIDHAFLIRRSGQTALRRHFNLWITAHPDYAMEVDSMERTTYGWTMRMTGRGTFQNDLPSKKASGKAFTNHGIVNFHVSGEGEGERIELLDEYYSWNFDDARGVEEYHSLKDP